MKLLLLSVAFVTATSAVASTPAAPNGAVIFQQYCAACHQSRGQGVPGAFPKLAADSFIAGDPKPVVATVLDGRKAMPSFKNTLKDAEIAAVLTHIRSHWGNKASPITPAMVSAARKPG